MTRLFRIAPGILAGSFLMIVAFLTWKKFQFLFPFLGIVSIASFSVICAIYLYDFLIICLFLSLPFSLNIIFDSFGTGIIFPSELIVGMLALAFFIRFMFIDKGGLSREFLLHPLTIMVSLYFLVLFATAIFSTMPLVSLKSVIVRFCYLCVFYFVMHGYFRKPAGRFSTALNVFGFPLVAIVIYILINHMHLGLNKNTAPGAVQPFFNDHTIYSATLVFILPFFIYRAFSNDFQKQRGPMRIFYFLGSVIFLVGIYFSYCRAAWISVMVAIIILLLIKTSLRLRGFLISITLLIFLGWLYYDPMIVAFRQNKVESSAHNAGFFEQTRSITNMTSDASNAERLNRWSCALRMFKDRPILGFGPGTFQFQYIGYQRQQEMTRISVSTPYVYEFGKGGTAHSEYFLALSESGLFSFLLYVSLLIATLFFGLRLVDRAPQQRLRNMAAIVMVGLMTYFTHSLFNNFLDNAKLAFLFWASLSWLATVDLMVKKGIADESA